MTNTLISAKAAIRNAKPDPITLSEGKDKIYLNALRMRRINRDYIDNIFNTYDAIVTPATAFLELPLGSIHDQSWRDSHRNLAHITSAMLCPSVLYGYPAISFPIGFTNSNLPIGINLFAPRFHEHKLLNIAYAFQEFTGLKCLRPDTPPL